MVSITLIILTRGADKPGRPPAPTLGESFDAMLERVGHDAGAFFPHVDSAGGEGHTLLTVKSASNHRQHAESNSMEQSFSVTSRSYAEVGARWALHWSKAGPCVGKREGSKQGRWARGCLKVSGTTPEFK